MGLAFSFLSFLPKSSHDTSWHGRLAHVNVLGHGRDGHATLVASLNFLHVRLPSIRHMSERTLEYITPGTPVPPSVPPALDRGLGLTQAVSLNITNMVGIGPFITIPLFLSAMGGP